MSAAHTQDAAYNGNNSTVQNNGANIQHNGYNGANILEEKPHQSTISQVLTPTRKPANPGPLGLISFALTTLCLGFYQAGVGLPGANSQGTTVGPYQAIFGLAVFYGGAVQAIAGLMEFAVGNTFGTTVHLSYGAFWLSFAMFLIPSLGIADAYGDSAAGQRAMSVHIGIYLMAWCFLTLIFFLGALRTNIAILTVFGLLSLAFFFLSIAEFIHSTHPVAALRVNRTGGAFAIFDAFAAFYAGAAGLMLPSTTFIKLPLGEFKSEAKAKANKSHV